MFAHGIEDVRRQQIRLHVRQLEVFAEAVADDKTNKVRSTLMSICYGFLRLASASVIWQGLRLTFALTYVLPEYSYTFTDGTEVEVAIVATLPHGKNGQRRRKWLLFVLIELDWTPKVVMRCYRRRFGIECTYRQMRQMRAVSSSRNPAMKFFLLGLSLVLVNLWARLRWQLFRCIGKGPRTVMADAFRLKRFIAMLRRAIESLFDAVIAVPTTASPQIVNY